MSVGWIIFAICLIFVVGAAIPLLRGRGDHQTPSIPRKETLRDWRNEK